MHLCHIYIFHISNFTYFAGSTFCRPHIAPASCCCKIQFCLLFICHSSYMRKKHQHSKVLTFRGNHFFLQSICIKSADECIMSETVDASGDTQNSIKWSPVLVELTIAFDVYRSKRRQVTYLRPGTLVPVLRGRPYCLQRSGGWCRRRLKQRSCLILLIL